MGFYTVNKTERMFIIPCPKCKSIMVRSGVLGDDLIHTLNRETGEFHTQMRIFGSAIYRCKKCQILIVVIIDPSYREGYIPKS